MRVLRHDPHVRVFEALLQNPRLTVGLLMPVARQASTPSEHLHRLADSARWGNRYDLKLQLCRNPQTPIHKALVLLPSLRTSDIAALARDSSLRSAVRRRAKELVVRTSNRLGPARGGPRR